MKVFVAFASSDREKAQAVAIRLRQAGHDVFLDEHKLEPGEEFDRQIRAAVQSADLLIFLASEKAVAPGSYTHTEVGWFEEKNPNPEGCLLTVVTDGVPVEKIPPYLRAVTVYRPKGNFAAETVDRAGRLLRAKRKRSVRSKIAWSLVALGVALAVGFAIWRGSVEKPELVEAVISQVRAGPDGDVFKLNAALDLPAKWEYPLQVNVELDHDDFFVGSDLQFPELHDKVSAKNIWWDFRVIEISSAEGTLAGELPKMKWRLLVTEPEADDHLFASDWMPWKPRSVAGRSEGASLVSFGVAERTIAAAQTDSGFVVGLADPSGIAFLDGSGALLQELPVEGSVSCIWAGGMDVVVGLRNPARLVWGRLSDGEFVPNETSVPERTRDYSGASEELATSPVSVAQHNGAIWVVTGGGSGEPALLRREASGDWEVMPYADGFHVDADDMLLRTAGGELWSFSAETTPVSLAVLEPDNPIIFGGHDHELIDDVVDIVPGESNTLLVLHSSGAVDEIKRNGSRLALVRSRSPEPPGRSDSSQWEDGLLAVAGDLMLIGSELGKVGSETPFSASIFRTRAREDELELVWHARGTHLVSLAAVGRRAILVSRRGNATTAEMIEFP